jgi:MoaA/NifB/PqqE/SkfB family radical SAM enzyme
MIWDRLEGKKKGIPYNIMSIENYTKIVKNLADLNFTGRVSPYLMNEPLMDKDRMVEIIGITRKYLPKNPIKINTNGTGLTTEFLGDMIDAGLTSIQIDDYFDDKYATKLLKQLEPFQGVNGKCFITLSSNYNVTQMKKGMSKDSHFGPFTFWNRGGLTNVNPDMPVPQKDCHFPSSQMYIKWNGDALLCCCDWEYKVIHGNVLNERIEDVWINDSYTHYRETLKKGHRDKLRMCRKCNKGAFPSEEKRLEHLREWMEQHETD